MMRVAKYVLRGEVILRHNGSFRVHCATRAFFVLAAVGKPWQTDGHCSNAHENSEA